MTSGDHVLTPPWWLAPVEAAALLALARLMRADLGAARASAATGWARGCAGGWAHRRRRRRLRRRRAAAPDPAGVPGQPLPPAAGQALFTALVVIPFGTVVLEEIAFRSVLWGMLARHQPQWAVLATTSVLFGLWHVLPALHVGSEHRGVSGAIGGGGPVGGGARDRRRSPRWAGCSSASCAAAAAACWPAWAPTGRRTRLGVLFGLLAWRLAG